MKLVGVVTGILLRFDIRRNYPFGGNGLRLRVGLKSFRRIRMRKKHVIRRIARRDPALTFLNL